MESLKQRWKNVPSTIRKPLVLIVGCLLIIAAILTGWLPGPGGIPLFLVGIAVLATEFEWAQRIRDPLVERIHQLGQRWRQHKVIGTLIIIALAAIFISLSIFVYTYLRK